MTTRPASLPSHEPETGTEWYGPAVGIVIAAADAAGNKPPPEWIELIPAGEFETCDERGKYFNLQPGDVVKETARIMAKRGLTQGIALDYDHAIPFGAPEGRPAPAAGWMKAFEVRSGAVWARVEWTSKGGNAVLEKEYAYISPVFNYRKLPDGKRVVTDIEGAALTNNPALNLQAVAAATQRSTAMRLPTGISLAAFGKASTMAAEGAALSEIAKTVEKAFPDLSRSQVAQLIEFIERLEGEPDDPESAEDDPADEPTLTAREGHTAECTDEACQGQCTAAVDDEAMAVAHARAMHGAEGEPTDEEMAAAREFLARHREIEAARAAKKEPASMTRQPKKATPSGKDKEIMALTTKVNSLEHERTLEKATATVDDAIRARKLPPAQRDWGIEYASRDLKGFKSFLDKQPTLMAPPTTTTRATTTTAHPALSDTTREVCSKLGITEEAFAKQFDKTKDDPRSGAAMMARHASV